MSKISIFKNPYFGYKREINLDIQHIQNKNYGIFITR